MTAPAIEAVGLTKDFEKGRRTTWQRLRREPDQRERFRAVDGVDLTVAEGEIFGILGPNGAGKTTTMRMLATLLALTSVGILGIGYLIGAIVLRMREGNFFVDATDFVFVALSGAAFPILVLPELVRPIAYLLPTTHALDLMRVASLGTPPLLPVPLEWLMLAVTSAASSWSVAPRGSPRSIGSACVGPWASTELGARPHRIYVYTRRRCGRTA